MGSSPTPRAMENIEYYVERYGESYRILIEDSLEWLDGREKIWNLESPIDRDEFIRDLISKVR